MNTVSFKTIGCRLNQAESSQIAAQFEKSGYRITPFQNKADVCVIHSCTITETAEKKSVQCARYVKQRFPETIVVLAGCAVEADTEERLKQHGIDILANQQEKFVLPTILKDHFHLQPQIHTITTPAPHSSGSKTRVLIKIQDGCDFGCAYCIVPQARGNPTSRPFDEIISEIQSMADRGYKEIILTGANLGRYSHGSRNLLNLLERIETLDKIRRIRLSSIEVSTTEKSVIDYMAQSEKVCHYIHLPLQSGDDTILKSMGRRYDVHSFRAMTEYAVDKIPDLGLGTDIITGFPGETDHAFQNTLKLVTDLPFNNLHVFPYSSRPGTRAADYPDQIEPGIRKERCSILIHIGETKRSMFASSFIGKQVSVLIERVRNGTAKGWTGEYLEAEIKDLNASKNNIIDFIPTEHKSAVLK